MSATHESLDLMQECARLRAELVASRAENAKLREVEKYARIFVDDSYRPAPKYDAMRYDDLKRALAALLEVKNDV